MLFWPKCLKQKFCSKNIELNLLSPNSEPKFVVLTILGLPNFAPGAGYKKRLKKDEDEVKDNEEKDEDEREGFP